jgi:hypothetical protein
MMKIPSRYSQRIDQPGKYRNFQEDFQTYLGIFSKVWAGTRTPPDIELEDIKKILIHNFRVPGHDALLNLSDRGLRISDLQGSIFKIEYHYSAPQAQFS